MKFLLTIGIVLVTSCLFSQVQDTTLVRLKSEVKLATSDSMKIKAMIALSEYEIGHDFSQAPIILAEVMHLLKKQADVASPIQLGTAYVQLGVVERRKANYTGALDHYFKAIKLFEREGDSLKVSDVYHNMGMVFRYQNDPIKAIRHYRKSIIYKEKVKDTHGIAAGYNMMGVSYRKLNNLDSALICYNKAKRLFGSLNSSDDLQGVRNNLQALYRSSGEFEKALAMNSEGTLYAQEHGRTFSLCVQYYNRSTIYKRMKDYENSLKFAKKSLAVALNEDFKNRISQAYLRMSYVQGQLGDYESAYFDYRLFNRYSDSIYNIENIKKIQALELNHKFEREQLADSLSFVQEKREVELVAANQKSKKNTYLFLFLMTLFGGASILFLIRKNTRNKNRLIQETLEKETLQKELLDQKLKINESETKRIIADNTMRLNFKQELLGRLKTEVLTEKNMHNVKASLQSLTSELQMQITTENKLSSTQLRIVETNKGFDEKLRELYPELTKMEREICALLRLNLSIKEIMTIRNASLDSVKSTRYRIRKKLGLTSGDELEKIIQNLY